MRLLQLPVFFEATEQGSFINGACCVNVKRIVGGVPAKEPSVRPNVLG
jgi:hypothetical protein